MPVNFKLFILSILFTSGSYGQLYKSHNWEKDPVYYEIDSEDETLASVAIKEKYLIQYYKPVLGNAYKLFETKHSIIRVNTEKGVKRHNRVYIPIRNVRRVIDIKARVLTKEGKIKLLNKTNIKELKNVKNYGSFKIFAIEGVTKNSQLEFIYTLEKQINSIGSVVVQKDYKVKTAEVILRKPASLISETKSYNGFPNFIRKVVEGNKKAYTAIATDIPAMIDEESATPDANRMKVSYVVRGNNAKSMWESLKNGIQRNYVNVKSKKIKKLVSEFEKYKVDNNNGNIINIISNYVNSRYHIVRSNAPEYDNLNTIISKKQATEQGIVKVYTSLFNYYKIPYELVLTSDRYRHKFDESFYSNFNLQELMIYFPENDKYIVPSHINSRLDFAPWEYISNSGFFVADNNYRFKTIGVPSEDHTLTIRNFILTINENQVGEVQCEQQLTGYKASNMRGAHKYFSTQDYNEFKNITATSGIEDAEIVKFDVTNADLDLITDNTPFEINWSYSSESLVENIGDDLLFNIGKVIGKQIEFYQEVKRVNPVEIRFPNTYNYKFEITIPEGYNPIGLEDLEVNEKVIINDSEACSFNSTYEIQEGKIIIKASETYHSLKMTLGHYEAYKKVVNSAFDFSKKGILFEKM